MLSPGSNGDQSGVGGKPSVMPQNGHDGWYRRCLASSAHVFLRDYDNSYCHWKLAMCVVNTQVVSKSSLSLRFGLSKFFWSLWRRARLRSLLATLTAAVLLLLLSLLQSLTLWLTCALVQKVWKPIERHMRRWHRSVCRLLVNTYSKRKRYLDFFFYYC